MTMPTLVLVRHGQSTTNAAGQFTGWADVPLTDAGEHEARRVGELLREQAPHLHVVHTSVLRRAIRTAEIALDVVGRSWLPVARSWRLNERHYGALTGRSKAEVRAEVGDAQFLPWRRGFRERPPPMPAEPAEALRSDPRYSALPARVIPDSESLADVLARVLPYWVDVLSADLLAGRVPLVVAHGNSLRALIMHLDQMSEDEVVELNIPTGIPLCYELDDALLPRQRGGHYLDPTAAAQAAAAVAEEGHRPARS
jgi:2,3-bisphosphoglycerate-dependent phosphoglycerate mutase